MAAIDNITNVRIELVVNGVAQEAIIADATTTTSVLPKIRPEDTVSGTAYIYVAGESEPRVAQLDETEAALGAVLKFKVPYNYTCFNLSNTQVASGTYFSRDGINLSVQTVSPIGGWHCIEDDTTHMGSIVTGVRGDINLYAVPEEGAPIFTATPDKTTLIGGSTTAGDTTATITVTNATSTPVITTSGSLIYNDPPVQDATDPTKYTVDLHLTGGSSAAMFDDDTSVTVSVMVGTETRNVTFTLKNKYSYQLQTVGTEWTDDPTLTSTYDYTTTAVEIEQGGTLTFAAAAAELNGHYPTDREIVSFYYDQTTAYYNKSPTPATITFSSASFTSRNVLLKAVPNMRINRNILLGGYAGTTPQDGSSARPYLLNYYGTTTQRKIQIEIYGNVCYNGNLTLEPDPSQTNIDNIMSTMFTRTQNDNKFTYELKSDLAKNSVYNGLIKLIATDPTTGSTKDVWIKVVKVGIGNKDTPNAVGDIVFTDGTAMAYTAFNGLSTADQDAKSPYAVAVIFYAGGNANLGNRVLGLGINSYNGNTYQGTQNDASAKGYLAYIEGLKSEPHWNGQASSIDGFISLIDGDVDGSDNLSVMSSYFNTTGKTDDTGTSGKYHAFQWPRDTYPGTRSNLTGTAYTTGWYLPTLPEMLMIYKNKGTVEAALAACGSGVTSTIPSGEYWTFSASTCNPSNHSGNSLTLLNMTTGNPDWDDGWVGKKILAVHRFN